MKMTKQGNTTQMMNYFELPSHEVSSLINFVIDSSGFVSTSRNSTHNLNQEFSI